MPTRFHDFNQDGEERLFYGRELNSNEPLALLLPQPHQRTPLALQQFQMLQQRRAMLEEQGFETPEEALDFDVDDLNFDANPTMWENAFNEYVAWQEKKASEGSQEPEQSGLTTEVKPNSEEVRSTSSSPLQGQENSVK